jgi:hypothetical protein
MDKSRPLLIVSERIGDRTKTFRIDVEKARYILTKSPDDLYAVGRYVHEASHMLAHDRVHGEVIFLPRMSLTVAVDEYQKIKAEDNMPATIVLTILAEDSFEVDARENYREAV